jgi:hypothetical protein
VAAVPAAALLVAGPSAAAGTPVVTFTGTIELPAATGTLAVQAEQGHRQLDPAVLTDVTVASQEISSGDFRISVPESAALAKAEANGWVPFVIVVESGKYVTMQSISVPVSGQAANGNAAVAQELSSRTAALPAFSPFRLSAASPRLLASSPGAIPPPCKWDRDGREQEKPIHIGEIHLTKQRHLLLNWDYGTEADTTVTVGYSATGDGHWTDSGSYTATNSISTDSGFSTGPDVNRLRYAVGQAYFQRYKTSGGCIVQGYKIQLDHMAGDSWLGGTGAHHNMAPKPNPFHGCLESEDPYGNVILHPGDHWSADRATAATISGGATVYGFSFSQSSGYTSNIADNYINNRGGRTTFICGRGYMPNIPIVYNDKI